MRAGPLGIATRRGNSNAPRDTELATLVDITQALSGTLHLNAAMHRVLELLAERLGCVRTGEEDQAAVTPIPRVFDGKA